MNRSGRKEHIFGGFPGGPPRASTRHSTVSRGEAVERRACTRRRYSVPISVSYFGGAFLFDAWTRNHGPGGLCFASPRRLERRAVLYIAVRKFHPSGPCTGMCEGLRSITLAEIMWCDRKIVDGDIFYPTGVRYYQSVY